MKKLFLLAIFSLVLYSCSSAKYEVDFCNGGKHKYRKYEKAIDTLMSHLAKNPDDCARIRKIIKRKKNESKSRR